MPAFLSGADKLVLELLSRGASFQNDDRNQFVPLMFCHVAVFLTA